MNCRSVACLAWQCHATLSDNGAPCRVGDRFLGCSTTSQPLNFFVVVAFLIEFALNQKLCFRRTCFDMSLVWSRRFLRFSQSFFFRVYFFSIFVQTTSSQFNASMETDRGTCVRSNEEMLSNIMSFTPERKHEKQFPPSQSSFALRLVNNSILIVSFGPSFASSIHF